MQDLDINNGALVPNRSIPATATSVPPATAPAKTVVAPPASSTAPAQTPTVIIPGQTDAQRAQAEKDAAASTPTATAPPTTGAGPNADPSKAGQPGYDVFGNPVASGSQTSSTPAGGTYKGQDGKDYYVANGQPVLASTTTSTTNGTTNNTDPNSPALSDQTDRAALAQAQAEYQTAAKQVQDTILNIQNGVTPLTAGENAQIQGLQQQFQQLIDQQTLQNTAASGTANIRGYQTGSAEYDPNFQVKTIGSIISAGAGKIADLQIKEASAVAALTQSFKDNDIKAVQDAYSVYQDASKARQDALKDTITDTAKAIKDAQDAKIAADKVQYDEVTKPIQDIATEAAKNGADAATLAKINSASDVASAVNAAGDLLQTGTGDVGDYLFYKRSAQALGQTPQSFDSYVTAQKYQQAYATAKGTEAGKLSAEGSSNTPGLTQSSVSSSSDFPQALKPYAKQSADGNWYLDLSSTSAATRDKLVQLAGDIPVITDKNASADLVNIKDANSKLQTIASIMKDLSSSSALSRDLGGAGLSGFAAAAQTDPKKAAAGALNDVALDVLKAISGVQGFRGNQSAIQQIKDTLPKITDTQDTVQQKLQTVAQLIADRETALVGTGNNDTTSFLIRTDNQAKDALVKAGTSDTDMQSKITSILSTKNPDTGQNYTYLDAAQILGIDIPAMSQGFGHAGPLFGIPF